MRRVAWALVIGAVVLVGGCSTPVEGTPSPVESTRIELPARPRDVPIAGVDPCSLLTEEQKLELELMGRSVFDLSPSDLYPGADVPACVISVFEPRAVSVGVSIVTTAGAELFASGELAADIRLVQVKGFPAIVAVPTRFTDFCTVVIDVAPGNLLDIQFGDGGRVPPIAQPQLCRDAETLAEAVMTTLLAR